MSEICVTLVHGALQATAPHERKILDLEKCGSDFDLVVYDANLQLHHYPTRKLKMLSLSLVESIYTCRFTQNPTQSDYSLGYLQ